MNWLNQNNKLIFFIIIALNFFLAPEVYGAHKWDKDSFNGDARFEFKYRLPAGADSELKRAAQIVDGVYKNYMPAGKLSSSRLFKAIGNTRRRKNIRSKLERANKLLSEFLDNFPDQYSQAYFIRGTSFLMMGKFSEALADFNSSLLNDFNNPSAADGAYAVLSYMWDMLSDEQKSEWAANIAGSIGSRIGASQIKKTHDYLLMAKLYFLAREYQKSMVVIQIGMEMDPTDSQLLHAKAFMYDKFSKK